MRIFIKSDTILLSNQESDIVYAKRYKLKEVKK
jgi:hypothetical protein